MSYFVSPYNAWFRELGYPRVDINTYEDGSWELIEFLTMPIVPCITKWQRILMDLKHIEPSYEFCKKYCENHDLERRHVWDEMERTEERHRQELLREELHATDFTNQAFAAIKQNPALMERIARNGLGEIGLRKLSRHIPNFRFRKDTKKPHAGDVIV